MLPYIDFMAKRHSKSRRRFPNPVIVVGLLCSVILAASCSDDESAPGPPPFPYPEYFWDVRVPSNFSDYQAVGVASIDTFIYIMANDPYFGTNETIRTTIVSADNGESWHYGTNLGDTTFHGLKQFDNKIFAIGRSRLFSTANGVNWTTSVWQGTAESSSCACELLDMARGLNGFVSVATRYLAFSADGHSWSLKSRPEITNDNVFFDRITFDGNRYVVLATNFTLDNKQIYGSTNGVDWSLLSELADPLLRDILFTPGSGYFIVGEGGAMYHSTDAVTWTAIESGTPADLLFIERLNGQFVTGGTYGTILISPDGADWERQNIDEQRTFFAIHWNGLRFVAVGENLIVVTRIPAS